MIVAKIVRAGGKLSLQLPDDFADENTEFSIRKSGYSVILEPVAKAYSWDRVLAWLELEQAALDTDFLQATSENPGCAENRNFHLLD